MNQWVCLQGILFNMFKDLCLGSAVLLNRTIAAKLQAMLKTPWIPPFTHGRKMSAHRSQWALQVR